jgi:leucyl-tRNA synthetase
VLGKLRGQVQVVPGTAQDGVVTAAKVEPNVAKHLEGKTIVKVVFVPGKLINFVVK